MEVLVTRGYWFVRREIVEGTAGASGIVNNTNPEGMHACLHVVSVFQNPGARHRIALCAITAQPSLNFGKSHRRSHSAMRTQKSMQKERTSPCNCAPARTASPGETISPRSTGQPRRC